MTWKPVRSFSASLGQKSIGSAGPDYIENDLDKYAAKFDPAITWTDPISGNTFKGGIEGGNIQDKAIEDNHLNDSNVRTFRGVYNTYQDLPVTGNGQGVCALVLSAGGTNTPAIYTWKNAWLLQAAPAIVDYGADIVELQNADTAISADISDRMDRMFDDFVSGCQVRGGVQRIEAEDLPESAWTGAWIKRTQSGFSKETKFYLPPSGVGSLTFSFIGTGLTLVTTLVGTAVSADVSIDGGATTTITCPSTSGVVYQYQIPLATGLTYGEHTITITPKVTNADNFSVDAFDIIQTTDRSVKPDAGHHFTTGNHSDVAEIILTHDDPVAGDKGRCDAVVIDKNGVVSIVKGQDGQSELAYRVEQNGVISKRYRGKKELHEDKVKTWMSSGWSTDVNSSLSSQSHIWANANGSTYNIGFYGTGIDAIVYATGNNGTYTVDGGATQTFDCTNTGSQYQKRMPLAANLPLGWHAVTITCTGTTISIDAFDIYLPKTPSVPADSQLLSLNTIAPLPGTVVTPARPNSAQEAGWVRYEDNSGVRFVGSGWASKTSATESGGTYYDTTNNTEYAEYTFVGTGVRYISALQGAHGNKGISIDGGAETIINTYSASYVNQCVVYEVTNLSYGVHTIRVTNRESGKVCQIDAFEVYQPLYCQDCRNLSPVAEATLDKMRYQTPAGLSKDLPLFNALAALDAALKMDGMDAATTAKGTYVRFPNGVMICYGNSGTLWTADANAKNIDYPAQFISNPRIVGFAADFLAYFDAQSISATSFQAKPNAYNSALSLFWIAIGGYK